MNEKLKLSVAFDSLRPDFYITPQKQVRWKRIFIGFDKNKKFKTSKAHFSKKNYLNIMVMPLLRSSKQSLILYKIPGAVQNP